MKLRFFHLLTLGLAASACDGDSLSGPKQSLARQDMMRMANAGKGVCLQPQVSAVFEFSIGAAEGVAVSPRGDVFIGNINSGEIWRAAQGDFDNSAILVDLIEQEGPLSFLLGLEVSSNGTLYAAVNAFLDPSVHGVWQIDPNGSARLVAPAPAFFASLLNDVAIDHQGNIYVSDSMRGAIWRLSRDRQFDVWIESELLKGGVHPVFGIEFGVNGLAYYKGALYGGIHLNGRIVRIPIEPDGTAGNPAIVVTDDVLIGNDGIELDTRGNIYVANNFANKVQQIRARDLVIETVAANGLSAPASLAFNANQDKLYVANLSTSAASPQPAAPALVQVELAAPVVARQGACASFN